MQNVFGNMKGSVHKDLGIPESHNLGHAKSLLEAIRKTKIGDTVNNPLVVGRRTYKVTKLLKKRAVVALTAIRIGEKNRLKTVE
jgi:hypothetical protein